MSLIKRVARETALIAICLFPAAVMVKASVDLAAIHKEFREEVRKVKADAARIQWLRRNGMWHQRQTNWVKENGMWRVAYDSKRSSGERRLEGSCEYLPVGGNERAGNSGRHDR